MSEHSIHFLPQPESTWWRHQMETFSAFPAQRPVTPSFDVLFDLHLNKRLSKQSWGWWFEMQSCPLRRQCNEMNLCFNHIHIWGFSSDCALVPRNDFNGIGRSCPPSAVNYHSNQDWYDFYKAHRHHNIACVRLGMAKWLHSIGEKKFKNLHCLQN